ncbi:hypothetical protein TNCV_3380791 [Trichonephila clavipes]|nr:hypothetical protein TNCV_3380791 [Trichonephila clavipes]
MQYLRGHSGVVVKCTVNGDSFGGEKNAASVEPITVHNIFQSRRPTANVICIPNTFRTISVDGRITIYGQTAVVGEDALKDDRRYGGFTVSGKRVDIMEPRRIPKVGIGEGSFAGLRTLGRSSSV